MLSNFVSKLRNSQIAKHITVVVENKKFYIEILNILWEHGFIKGYTKINDKNLLVYLLYEEGTPLIKRFQTISKSTNRVFVSCLEISAILSNNGLFIISTPYGLIEGSQAVHKNIGGEILIYLE
uniref:ribosomal protein S8 n=1 Tax=Dictyotopsis propagulifera TaxID=670095 RepID=UPI002E760ABB|nr:ribosomal protein S8 [Dictyotopsis propagulifera]WBP69939.1 ribosomal protein S8 [Dictyotopsis propagulifera]